MEEGHRVTQVQQIRRGCCTAVHMNALVRPEQLLAGVDLDGYSPIDKPCFGNPTSLIEYMLVCGYDDWLEEEPIEVWVYKHGRLEVHDGNHRITAAYEVGLELIPVNIYYRHGSEKVHALAS